MQNVFLVKEIQYLLIEQKGSETKTGNKDETIEGEFWEDK